MVVERGQRLAKEHPLVGQPWVGSRGSATSDLEIEPLDGNLAWIERCGEPPRRSRGRESLSNVGDLHESSLSRPASLSDNPAMARLQAKSIADPDEVRTFPNGSIAIFSLDDVIIGRTLFQPGWHWATDVKPIAGTASCQYHHLGVCVTGRLGIRMDDGTTFEVGPNSVFDIPPGHDGWVIGDDPWETYDFAGMRAFGRAIEPDDRVLASIVFTDVVDSTATAERLGDKRWRALISAMSEQFQHQADRHRGRLVKTTGDGVIALFDSSERAVRFAEAAIASARELGLGLRAAVHTGEVELSSGDVRGLAVHMTSRILALAGDGEVLLSASTHELLSDSTFAFEDRGEHELKGITGRRRVYAVGGSPIHAG